MSGGLYDYRDSALCHEIFGWRISPDYGSCGFTQSAIASRINPLEDKIISEMVFDMFCLLRSFDWYRSGDNSEDQYRADVQTFKDKWLNASVNTISQRFVENCLNDCREEIYKTLGIKDY